MNPAIRLRVGLAESTIAPGADVPFAIELCANELLANSRTHSTVVMLIDASTSMRGVPLEEVKASVKTALDLFSANDRLGLVTFSGTARERLPITAMASAGKHMVRDALSAIVPSFGTNVDAGLHVAAEALRSESGPGARLIVLLSDGQPTEGEQSPARLTKRVADLRPGISVMTLGYGAHHDGVLLEKLSKAGGGDYRFISDPKLCRFIFTDVLEEQCATVATDIAVDVTAARNVTVKWLSAGQQMLPGPNGRGMMLPNLVSGRRHVIAGELLLAHDDEQGVRDLFSVSIRYRAADNGTVHTINETLRIPDDPLRVTRLADVKDAMALIRIDDARSAASILLEEGKDQRAAAVARATLDEITHRFGSEDALSPAVRAAFEYLTDEIRQIELGSGASSQQRHYRRENLGRRLSSFPAGHPTSAPVGASSVPRNQSGRERIFFMIEGAPDSLADTSIGTGFQVHADGRPTRIGRGEGVEIRLVTANVAMEHVIIRLDNSRYLVEARHEAVLNGEILAMPEYIKHGDLLEVCGFALRCYKRSD